MIRPEDISLVESTQGLFTATVDSMLLEVYITKFVVLMRKGMNGLFNLLKDNDRKSGRFVFEPEAIHIMVPGETEEEFDKRIESYEDIEHA